MKGIHIKGDNNGIIKDGSITVKNDIHDNMFIFERDKEKEDDSELEIEVIEISMKELLLERVREFIIGILSGLIAGGNLNILKHYDLEQNIKNGLIVVMIIAGILALAFFGAFIDNIFNIWSMKEKGIIKGLKSPMEFVLKIIEFILDVLSQVFSANSDMQSANSGNNYKYIKKVYQNIDGKVYEIKSAQCPFCELEPIGKMRLWENTNNSTYELRCSQQPKHRITYDHKKKYKMMKGIENE